MSRTIKCSQTFPFPYWQRIIKVVGDPMDNKKFSQTELSKELDMENANLKRILYKMERAGFIVRIPEPKGIEITIGLTARGRIIWKDLCDIENNVGYRVNK